MPGYQKTNEKTAVACYDDGCGREALKSPKLEWNAED